jgi:2-keto-4-pentenoate hydratase/2-oxohepta-3-ene-1,7-dioic acid hydratase in catechol pathway
MRFAHLKAAERPLAVVDDGRATPLSLEGIDTVDDLIAAGTEAWRAAESAATGGGEPLRAGMLDAPLAAPSKIACIGLNYHDHCGFRDPPVFLEPGDTVEVEVEGIGVLANDIGRNTT